MNDEAAVSRFPAGRRMRVPLERSLAAFVIGFGWGCEPVSDARTGIATLELVAQATDETADVAASLMAAAGSHGRAYVGTQTTTHAVMILDSAGTLLGTLGRPGSGPGEFTVPRFIVQKADSIAVSDLTGRMALFDPEGRFVRQLTYSTPHANQALFLRGDTLVAAADIASRDRSGLPLHLFAPNGDIVRSFGSEDRSVDPEFQRSRMRFLTAESDSSFWVARPDRYVLELWSSGGVSQRRFELTRDWWVPMVRDLAPYWKELPPSHVKSVHRELPAGNLLVLIYRARPNWKPSIESPASAADRPMQLTDFLQNIEQLVEVVDPQSGDLVATVINSSGVYLERFLNDGRLVGIRTDDDGREMPVFFRLRYRGRAD